jgi:hypothetical protein
MRASEGSALPRGDRAPLLPASENCKHDVSDVGEENDTMGSVPHKCVCVWGGGASLERPMAQSKSL